MNSFKIRKNTSQYWFNKASDLHASAAALWISQKEDFADQVVHEGKLGIGFRMDVAVRPVYLMIFGMAIELIFKAIIVQKGLTVNDSNHDLLVHLSETGLTYSSAERELLKILSHSITWSGRYPVPKKECKMEEYDKLVRTNLYDHDSVGNITVLRPNKALEWRKIEKLWTKAVKEYSRISL
jgi:hypothetical protein